MTQEIDAIAAEAIREQATPGLVVMAIKNGQVIFEKAYGNHTYEAKQKTSIKDIFDLASISKIAGTTPVIMKLQETNAIHWIVQWDLIYGMYVLRIKKILS